MYRISTPHSCEGGVGEANDVYERHADRIAEAVVKGEPAAPLLDQTIPGADN